jgi:hypothetical protein
VTIPPLTVTRTEIHVVEPIASAVHDCGHWPVVGTLAEYQEAVKRAWRGVYHALELEHRYWRRFHLPVDDNEPICARLRMRREVALAIAEQRSECLTLLTEPAVGSA